MNALGFSNQGESLVKGNASHRYVGANRSIPFVGVDILRGAEAVKSLEYWVKERSFKGLTK